MTDNCDTRPKNVWTAEMLEDLLNGKWIIKPPPNWCCWNLAISEYACVGDGILFIAIDSERWVEGTKNTGAYAAWTDTHTILHRFQKKIVGVVAERHIRELDSSVPQLLVENSYEAIRILGAFARENLLGKVIAITGTAGKSTTKMMIQHLLEPKGKVISNHGNHNSRTGVPLTLGRCITQPEYCVLEVAVAALWMRAGGICMMARPHISVITEIALGQVEARGSVTTVRETARMKARIAQGIEPGGIVVLNRDMEEYDFVKSEIEAYGATPVSYGFHEDADFRVEEWQGSKKGSWVTAKVFDRSIRYYLPVLGKSMVSNSLAALAAVHSLGINPEEVTNRFESIHLKESVLESLTVDLPTGGKVYILDDSYNAEALSMKSALEAFKSTSLFYSGKKICILGRIVNLGENAENIHRELAEPVIQSGADIVFAYGNEMQYLLDELPEHMIGGFYSDIEACAQAVANILEPEDYILLKGSRRANDFGKIRGSLSNAIQNRKTMIGTKIAASFYIPYSKYCVQAVDAETGELMWSEGNPYAQTDRGIGGAVLLALLFEKISLGAIKLNDYVTIGSVPSRDAKANRAMSLQEGEEVSVYTLLSSLICLNAPDAALALAEKMAGNTNKALSLMKNLAKKLKLSQTSTENITGRLLKSKPQSFNITDLNKIGRHLFSLPMAYLKMLNISIIEYKGQIFTSPSNLIARGKISGGYFFGKNDGEGITLIYINNQKIILTVCGARDSFHRDYLLSRVIDRLTFSQEEKHPKIERNAFLKSQDNKNIIVNIMGDTYFGEDYTIRRQRRGREDALTRYGYDYSFQKIEPLLKAGDLNIANFEAVLTDLKDSPLRGIKPYVLGGNIIESIATLRKFHIDTVTLANNHAMDYGIPGLNDTLKAFAEADIKYIGAGYNDQDASEPLRINIADSEIIIFSGYWYRDPAHYLFDMYALGNKPGVACISGELMDRIKQEKSMSAKAFIIVIAHWGIDFQKVQNHQRTYAKQLIDSGADMIIGHGSHMMQEMKQLNGKWVLYSIGNAVFNSDGEYDKRKAPPYSFFLQIRIERTGKKSLRLYPLFCNNLKTFWQPHVVTDDQFKEVIKYQTSVGTNLNSFSVDCDKFGPFIETKI